MTEIAGVPFPQLPVTLPSAGDVPTVVAKGESAVAFDAILASMNARAMPAKIEAVAVATDHPTQQAERDPAESTATRSPPAEGATIIMEDPSETIAPPVRHEPSEDAEAVKEVAVPPVPYHVIARVADVSTSDNASTVAISRTVEVAEARPAPVAAVIKTVRQVVADPRPIETPLDDEPATEARVSRVVDKDLVAPLRAENGTRPIEVAYRPVSNATAPDATPPPEIAAVMQARLPEPAPRFEPQTEIAKVTYAARAQVFNETGLFRPGQVVQDEAIVAERSDILGASVEQSTSGAGPTADKSDQAAALAADNAEAPVTAPVRLAVRFAAQAFPAGSSVSARPFVAPDSAMSLPVAASPLRVQSRAVSASSDRPAKAARPFIPDPQETTAAAVQVAVEASDHGMRVAIAAEGLHRDERERLRDRVAATMSRRGLPIQSINMVGLPAPHHPIATGKD